MTPRIELDINSKWRVVVPTLHVDAEFPVVGWQVHGGELLPLYVDHNGIIHSLVKSNHIMKYRLTSDQWNTSPTRAERLLTENRGVAKKTAKWGERREAVEEGPF